MIMESATPKIPISASGLGWISDVPAYERYLGCFPTAAGTVLGYLDNHGHPNFPSETSLIEELADAMETESVKIMDTANSRDKNDQ